MRLRPRFTLSLLLLLLCLNASLLNAELGFSSLISLGASAALQDEHSSEAVNLLLQPEAFIGYSIGDKLELYAEGSVQYKFFNDLEHKPSSELELYRLWGRVDYAGWELRAGLQQLNFGSAKVLRPLQWFDQIDPQDKLELTSGVSAILLRHYFNNDFGFWAWGLKAKDGMGIDGINAVSNDPELGGRLEFPMLGLETGLTFHTREFEHGMFAQDYREYRLGLDLRYDGVFGAWMESTASAIDQLNMDEIPETTSALCLGADYTLGIGNGLYLMQEIYWQDYSSHFNSYANNRKLATMASYPLGLLDNLQFLYLYDYNFNRKDLSLGWQRNYDYLSWELRIQHVQAKYTPPIYGLNLRISYNI